MTITVLDHGSWVRYKPDVWPEGAPLSAMFSRRTSDDIDWYAFSRNAESWSEGSLRVTCIPTKDGPIAASIVRDSSLLFPSDGGQIIEIIGHDPDDPSPHKSYEGRIVDLQAGSFSLPEPPLATQVSSAQAQTALFKRGLLDKVMLIIEGHPYEPVRIFFRSANNWIKSDPFVQAVAMELDLDSDELDALFEEASKL